MSVECAERAECASACLPVTDHPDPPMQVEGDRIGLRPRARLPSLKRAAMVWWRTGAERARWLRVANPVSFVGTAVLNGLGGAGIIGRGVGQVRQYRTCVSRGRVALLVAAC